MALLSLLLREVLVCPVCRGELEEDEARSLLRCPNNGLEFPVRDGIPMMLVNEEGGVMSEEQQKVMRDELLAAEAADPDAFS